MTGDDAGRYPSVGTTAETTLDLDSLVGIVLDHTRAVLDSPRLLPTEDFFDAGVDSVLAVELADRLSEAIGVEIPVAYLYMYPTAEDMAEVLGEEYGKRDGAATTY